MPPFVYLLAGGGLLVWGYAVLGVSVAGSVFVRKRWVVITNRAIAVLAMAGIVVSSPGLPWGWAIIGCVGLLVWLVCCRRSTAVVAGLVIITATVVEMSRERFRPLPMGHQRTLYVIGDSITAGLGRAGETTWPALLQRGRSLRVVDLSRAGSTVAQSIGRVPAVIDGVVLIEIGGNDLIGRVPAREFESELDRLARAVCGEGRPVAMFELPRFPLDDGYGIAQRRVAERYGIDLVPRRFMASVLGSDGATVDGIHLTNAGQRRMAELVWRVVGAAMGG